MSTNNHTVQAILSSQSDSEIITTINHNFQVLTERIKELNVSLSYLDLLKISTIFQATDPGSTPSSTIQDANLQNFVSTCWNTLANYAGVYIQCPNTQAIVFRWMDKYNVKNGDFIVKLPNNQSLYLAGASPMYMVPESYDATNNRIIFKAAPTASEESIDLDLSNIPAGRFFTSTSLTAGATIPTHVDCRFYIDNEEEIFFSNYTPGSATFSVPVACTAYYIY